MEAVRRYYGVCQNLELDQVSLKAVVGGNQNSKYPVVQFVNKSLTLVGAAYGISLDF